jgi:hypothetical protein
MGAVLLVVLAVPPVRLPADAPGLRRFRTPEISSSLTVSQTFTMPVAGLNAVAITAVPAGPHVSGLIELALVDLEASGVVERHAVVPAAALLEADSYRFEFAPIPRSMGKAYRLDVAASGDDPATGVALVATKGDRYAGGTMLANGRPRWADLAFETDAPVARSSLESLLEPEESWSAGLRDRVILAAVLGYWIAFGAAIRRFFRLSAAGEFDAAGRRIT